MLEHADRPLAPLGRDHGQGEPSPADDAADRAAADDLELLPGVEPDGREPVDRGRQRTLREVREEVDRAKGGGVGHVVEVMTSAIEATALTVACAATDAQYPRLR